MSASPSGPPFNGQTPSPNAGGRTQFIRKPRPADPLRQNKKPTVRAPPLAKSVARKPNGLVPVGKPGQPTQNGPRPSAPPNVNGVPPVRVSVGFTNTPTGPYQDFPLVTTKRALREGLRYHVARFAGRKEIDPTNQDDFIRPVSLHRRDPRQPPPGKIMKDEDVAMGDILDDKEREKQEIAKAERDAQRAADLAQIAPTGNNAAALASKKSNAFRNEKTTQVFRVDQNEEQKKESDLRYEESLPWHLEDAENKHTFVGTYEAALSDTNAILIIEDGKFKMVPVEKWYKFTAKNQFKTLTIEEVETAMSKKTRPSRWTMEADQLNAKVKEEQSNKKFMGKLYLVKGESATFKRSGKSETQDTDDIDFEDDLFADDDEQPTFEKEQDEETKFAEEKIKREQRGANLFGTADEAEVDKELEKEEKEKDYNKKQGKGINKALKRRERNYIYDSDSSHPYSTESEDDTSDEEKQKEEDRKKDEEAKLKAKLPSKLPSGASSKGTNTPIHRPKHGDPQKKHNHLKRPGSPNLSASETSGNESTRKKHKKKHAISSAHATGTSTPLSQPSGMSSASPTSQPLPGQLQRKSSIIKLNVNSNKLSEIQSTVPNPSSAMSDGEATAGEMSDGVKAKKKSIKLRLGSSVSPNASRAGSPSTGSRAGSPGAPVVAQVPAQQSSMQTIYPPISLILTGFFTSSTHYTFRSRFTIPPSMVSLVDSAVTKESRARALFIHGFLTTRKLLIDLAPSGDLMYLLKSQIFLLTLRDHFEQIKSYEEWLVKELNDHLLTAHVLCYLDPLLPPATDEVKPVTAEEIAAALPPEGIAIGPLLKLFAGRIQDKPKFITMVKENSKFSHTDKLLRPKV